MTFRIDNYYDIVQLVNETEDLRDRLTDLENRMNSIPDFLDDQEILDLENFQVKQLPLLANLDRQKRALYRLQEMANSLSGVAAEDLELIGNLFRNIEGTLDRLQSHKWELQGRVETVPIYEPLIELGNETKLELGNEDRIELDNEASNIYMRSWQKANQYTNNLKNREFDKEASHIFGSERAAIAERLRTLDNSPGDCYLGKQVNAVNWPERGTVKNKKYETRPKAPKTDSAGFLCMNWYNAIEEVKPLSQRARLLKEQPSFLIAMNQVQRFIDDTESLDIQAFRKEVTAVITHFKNSQDQFNHLLPIYRNLSLFGNNKLTDEQTQAQAQGLLKRVTSTLADIIKSQKEEEQSAFKDQNLRLSRYVAQLNTKNELIYAIQLKDTKFQAPSEYSWRIFKELNAILKKKGERELSLPVQNQPLFSWSDQKEDIILAIENCFQSILSLKPDLSMIENISVKMEEALANVDEEIKALKLSQKSSKNPPLFLENTAPITNQASIVVGENPYDVQLVLLGAIENIIREIGEDHNRDLAGLQEALSEIAENYGEQGDDYFVNMLYEQTCILHERLGRFNEIDGYGRLAFINALPTSNATFEHQIEVINRVRLYLTLGAIRHDIESEDILGLGQHLSALERIELQLVPFNKPLIDGLRYHVPNEYRLAIGDAAKSQFDDFGQISLEHLEGFAVPKEIKLAALDSFQDELQEKIGL